MNLRDRARILRKSMTPQEIMLWSQLKHLNREGYHFRRQPPVDGYILDFAEFHHRLIIEVDGGQHAGDEKDKRRDAHFSQAGFKTLRFWNHEINTSMEGVIDAILAVLKQGPPPALRATSPATGGGKPS